MKTNNLQDLVFADCFGNPRQFSRALPVLAVNLFAGVLGRKSTYGVAKMDIEITLEM